MHRLFPVPGQALEDGPPSRVRKSSENVIGCGLHDLNHNHTVIGCQVKIWPSETERRIDSLETLALEEHA
jgi:hypothetical protein